jgi:nicotinate-nucleotide adenylyltransferase
VGLSGSPERRLGAHDARTVYAPSAQRMIGLIGGSFDPIHHGHLQLALAVSSALALDETRFMPAKAPWQKAALGASAEHRAAMVAAAISPYATFSLERFELDSASSGATIDTLAALRSAPNSPVENNSAEPRPAAEPRFVLLLGADQWLNLTTWKRWQDLFSFADIAVAGRPGYELAQSNWPPALLAFALPRLRPVSAPCSDAPIGSVYLVDMPPADVSATQLRTLLTSRASDGAAHAIARERLSRWLPAPVLDYIHTHNLYRTA